jgi:hypothetical protein
MTPKIKQSSPDPLSQQYILNDKFNIMFGLLRSGLQYGHPNYASDNRRKNQSIFFGDELLKYQFSYY